jgi:hypothetical protein
MGDEVKWFRVVDPLSPLFGSDVRCASEEDGWMLIDGLRRVDIFMGDRPFQLLAPEGEDLGLRIDSDCLRESHVQDDVVELVTDRPFGISIDEGEMTRDDGLTLTIARFERAVQVALKAGDDELLATKTFVGDPEFAGADILEMFERGDDVDDITFALKRRD